MQEKTIWEYFKESVTHNYANFNGRARRKEYWGFTLVNFLISLLLTSFLSLISPEATLLGNLYSFAVLIPSLAVAVRRLHDVGKSGWFLLLILIPIIGAIWLLVLFFTDGDAQANEYGPNPKMPQDEIDMLGRE